VSVVAAVVLSALAVCEYRTRVDRWELPASGNATLGLTRESVLLELPLPSPARLDASVDAFFMVERIGIWPRLVNGYSGSFPAEYLTMLDRVREFPDDRALNELGRLKVTHVALHEAWLGAAYGRVLADAARRPELLGVASYRNGFEEVALFRLLPPGAVRPGADR
jgi:hypothetical protein